MCDSDSLPPPAPLELELEPELDDPFAGSFDIERTPHRQP